jgi:hypothetical protein
MDRDECLSIVVNIDDKGRSDHGVGAAMAAAWAIAKSEPDVTAPP